jgi:hypothetical protein
MFSVVRASLFVYVELTHSVVPANLHCRVTALRRLGKLPLYAFNTTDHN